MLSRYVKSLKPITYFWALELCAQRGRVEWVDVDAEKNQACSKAFLSAVILSADINESLIVELYSK